MLFLQDSKAAGKAPTGMVATVAANTLTSSIFGVAAFAQPAMGRVFLAGQENALDFYNNVYAAPLFITALMSVLLFIVGGVFHRDRHRCIRPLAALDGMGICSHYRRLRSQQLPFPSRAERNISLALRRDRCGCVECEPRSCWRRRKDGYCHNQLARFALAAFCCLPRRAHFSGFGGILLKEIEWG